MNRPSEDIIEKVLDGLASKDDARLVAEWFATIDGQAYLSSKMDKDFASFSGKSGYEELFVGENIPTEDMYHIIMQHIKKRKLRRILFRAASILIPFVLVSGLFFQLNSKVDLFGQTKMEEVYVPKGERLQFMFQDGTRAYINSDTRVRYPQQFGLSDRTIYIEGEAYFDVSPNKNRPFIVELEKGSIKVLGTSFNVEAYKEDKDIRVTLDEGKINLISWTQKQHILNPGERIIYNKESGDCTIVKEEETQSISSWKKDIITFSNTPMTEVLEKLNRWYDIEFIIEDQEVLKYSYTIILENTLLENVLLDLEKVAPVQFTVEGKVVKVNMK